MTTESSEDCTSALQVIYDSRCVDDNNVQQVNCKGDKIENISQLLTHLGMNDIKHKCDECDIEKRKMCLETGAVKEHALSRQKVLNLASVDINKAISKQHDDVFESQSDIKAIESKHKVVENRLIISSLFASVLVAVMTF